MADGHGAVAVQQQHCHRLADDVGASDDDALLALRVDAVLVQNLHDARRRARLEVKIADHDLADVDRMERIDILARIDRVDDSLLADVLRYRHLAQNAADVLVVVQLADEREQFLLCGLLRQCILFGIDAALLAGALLVADIDLARRILTDDDNRKTRADAVFLQLVDFLEDASAYLCGYHLAVHSDCTHCVSS